MLVASDIPVITFDDLYERETKNCPVSCDCSTYLSHGLCKNSFAFAMEHKVLTEYPQSMNLTSRLQEKSWLNSKCNNWWCTYAGMNYFN